MTSNRDISTLHAAASTSDQQEPLLRFWSHDEVPDSDNEEFRGLIFRDPELEQDDSEDQADQNFVPKDEHCAMWHSSPNSECHASFGDEGTTASVSCYGHLVQMSRYLGVGKSGMFSMNQRSSEEPYKICGRVRELHSLSTRKGDILTFGLGLSPKFCPNQPPQVKWVNRRWPRYEYDTQLPDVKACVQWIVHKGVVLQQLFLENSGDHPVDFQFVLPRDICIQDLNDLHPDYQYRSFNEKEGFLSVPGPNGYGLVYVRDMGMPRRDLKFEGNASSSEDDSVTMPPAPIRTQPSKFRLARTLNRDLALENTLKATGSARRDPKIVKMTDEHIKRSSFVAALINPFVNGRAFKVQDNGDLWHELTLEGKHQGSQGMVHGTLEIVVAYKLIFLQGGEINWKNFLVPANEVNVSRILREETGKLWEGAEIPSVCSLGLSLGGVMDSVTSVSNCTFEGHDEISNVKLKGKDESSDHIDARVQPNTTVDTGIKVKLSPRKADYSGNTLDGAQRQSSSGPAGSSLPSGTPTQESSYRSHIEYVAWKHLEYILSVCAIPVPHTTSLGDHSKKEPGLPCASPPASWEEEVKDDDTPVALTCGDMSGHLICTSASYFAFQFLIEVARTIAQCPAPIPYIKTTQKRIKKVLWGHVKWLESLRTMDQQPGKGKRKRLLKSGCFAANYWVTGHIKRFRIGHFSWQPTDSVTDTAFHVLKLIDYMELCKESGGKGQEAEELVRRILRDVWVPWFRELDNLDKRASFAWPHAADKGYNTFRLADHFWIWRTLKALHDSGVSNPQSCTNSKNESDVWDSLEKGWILRFYDSDPPNLDDKKRAYEKFAKVVKRLHPDGVQRGILQRFTTENDVLQKRMLAVTRSPRETRFFFHSRDTALFYGQDCGFFLPGSHFQELWNRTIEAQIHHKESHETGWDKALRYALGIRVGCSQLMLNNRSSEELVRKCVKVLISSTGHNGFFPGQLDVATKEPDLFYDQRKRDSYYHAGFEIHYVLLTHARAIDGHFNTTETNPSCGPKSVSTMSSREKEMEISHERLFQNVESPTETTGHPKFQGLVHQRLPCESCSMFRQPAADLHTDSQPSRAMRKTIPVNSLIDAASINEIGEEWLYPYPHFFSDARIDVVKQVNRYIALLRSRIGPGPNSTVVSTLAPYDPGHLPGIIRQQLDSYLFCSPRRDFVMRSSMNTRGWCGSVVFVVDTPKQKRLEKRGKRNLENMNFPGMLHNDDLVVRIGAPRTVEHAKKRFIWLPHANEETALVCWTTSPEQEKAAVSRFFDRHSRYEKHVWDAATRLLNTWHTELHLSFYVLVEASMYRNTGLPPLTRHFFPGDSKKEMRRASMGFRFDGDFFDRYWTCHYIEHVPSKERQSRWGFPFTFSSKDATKQWGQRKVLELYLLDCILREIEKGAVAVLTAARDELGVRNKALSFSILESETYTCSEDNWHNFEEILHAVEDDLTSSLDTLQKWSYRERDRGQEKPRWTRNDERKYRDTIAQYRGSTERHMRDLVIHRDTIRKLKDNLATKRQKIHDDRELRRNENIRYFTYVTVIFLPLDFAASFYSMNGMPEHDLLVSVIKFAVGAFAVTVALLASAKTLFLAANVLVLPLRRMRHKIGLAIQIYSRYTMSGSFLMYVEKYRPSKRLAKEGLKRGSLSPYYFWPAYIFLEIPARRVLIASSELKSGGVSPRAAAHVLLGILFLPVLGLSLVIRIVFLNIRDVADFLGYVATLLIVRLSNAMPRPTVDNQLTLLRRFERMTDPPKASRPLKILQERINRRPESPVTSKKPGDESESSGEEHW